MNKIKVDTINNDVIEIKDGVIYDLSNDKRLKLEFILKENSKLHIVDISNDIRDRKYTFTLNDNSYLEINKFYNIKNIDEIIDIKLDGINSEVVYNFSTILEDNQKYKLNISHNNKNTKSRVINHGVVGNDSSLYIEVNGTVKKGCTDSILNQDSKIITLGANNSIIKPNLYIDEYSVEAKHGASIGRFNKDQIFYMKSRGINEELCNKLLTRGFLLSNLNMDNKDNISF